MDNQVALISVSDIITQSWEKVKGTKASIWAAFGILFVIMLAIGFISGLLKNGAPVISASVDFIGQIINFLLQMGILYIGISRAYDLPISYRMMFRTFQFEMALKVIGLYLLQILIFLPVAIIGIIAAMLYSDQILLSGLLFLISIFAIFYLAVRLFLSMGFVVYQGINPVPAIKKSFQATHGNFWRILSILIIQFCILVISIIPLGIGLIWSLPFCFIVYGMLYKNLVINVRS